MEIATKPDRTNSMVVSDFQQYKPSEKELTTNNQPLPPFNTTADEMST